MNTTKQTIVEMRYPITAEVLNFVRLEAQQEGNNIFFRYVYITEGTPKEATAKAKDYFKTLFAKAPDVRITQTEIKQTQKASEQHIEQITDIKRYEGEDNVI
jgi:hypothetical protein